MPDLFSPRVHKGFINTWTGTVANIPRGWAICDGNVGTPNLLDKFVRCVPNSSTDPGTTGGSTTHVLLEAELAAHNHSFSESAHNHTNTTVLRGTQNNGDGAPDIVQLLNGSAQAGVTSESKTTGATINNAGSDTAHENEPAHFEIAYIMKVSDL